MNCCRHFFFSSQVSGTVNELALVCGGPGHMTCCRSPFRSHRRCLELSGLNQSSVCFLLLFSCIVYFVYFTNYFRVCIFVYLLTINFVRVLIVYFQNIVYSCITIDFTISYVKIVHIHYIQCTCNYSIYFCYFI